MARDIEKCSTGVHFAVRLTRHDVELDVAIRSDRVGRKSVRSDPPVRKGREWRGETRVQEEVKLDVLASTPQWKWLYRPDGALW